VRAVQTTPVSPISHKRRLKFLIGGGVIVALLIGLVVYATAKSGSTAYFLTTTELASAQAVDAGKDYRVNGKVVPGSIETEGLETTFSITDGTTEMTVLTTDPLPDTFKENSEVIARGEYNGRTFAATEVLAKCPSKFKAKD
jgi:cytochrome c-type biogenesis protein CcmE